MAYMRQLRIKEVLNGWLCSTAPYKETFCKDMDEVIRFMKRHFSQQQNETPKRYYGEKKDEQ